MRSKRIVRIACWFVLAVAPTWSCTPTRTGAGAARDGASPATPPVEVHPAPAPAPPPGPQEPPPPASPPSESPAEDRLTGLDALVGDLAVAMAHPGKDVELYVADSQTSVAPEWAGSLALRTPRIAAGETLHGICPDGAADWQTALKPRGVTLRREGVVAPSQRTLCLMTKDGPPSPQARLDARPLVRLGADAKPIRAWVARKFAHAMRPVGEVRGVFGGGVDRIVVFTPARRVNFQDAATLHPDAAVLVASGTPVALLPLAEYDEDEYLDIRVDLQVAAVFDLDGDGVEEVLWLSEDLAEDGSGPILQVSYFVDGEHRVHDVLRKSYSNAREFGGRSSRPRTPYERRSGY